MFEYSYLNIHHLNIHHLNIYLNIHHYFKFTIYVDMQALKFWLFIVLYASGFCHLPVKKPVGLLIQDRCKWEFDSLPVDILKTLTFLTRDLNYEFLGMDLGDVFNIFI